MIVGSILALVAFGSPLEAPKLLEAFADHGACMVAADKRNRTDEALRTPALRAVGAEYACLKIVRGGV